MRLFLQTLRVLRPTSLIARLLAPHQPHAARAQSQCFAAGPGLANLKEIKRFRRGGLQVAAQANVQIDAEIGQKGLFRMEPKKKLTEFAKLV